MIMWSKEKGAAHASCADDNPAAPDITYERINGNLELSFPFHTGHLSRVKTIPGRFYDAAFKMWTVPDNQQTWDTLGEWLVDADEAAIKVPKTLFVSDNTSHPDYPYLMKHQAQVVNTVLSGHKKLYLGLPAGTGKSLASFASVDALDAYPLLIVCLAINKVNWQRELKKFAGLESQILESRTPSEITEKIAIINYDILPWWADFLEGHNFKAVIYDESAYIKNPEAKRTKASKQVSSSADALLMLSGTPAPTSPYDLVPALETLDHIDAFGGRSKYVKRYCPPVVTRYGTSHSQYTNLEELHENLKNSCFIAWKKEELVDLPDLLVYDEEVEAKSETVERLLAAMGNSTSHQAAEIAIEEHGDSFDMFSTMRREAGEAKIKSIIAEAEAVAEYEKVIIGVHHREVNDEVAKALGKKFKTVQIIGGMSMDKRQRAIDSFQDGDAQVMVMSIVAGGVAINLQNASHMIIAELPPSYAEQDQFISRSYRSGQKRKVTVKRLVAPETLDAILVGLISKKEGLHVAIESGEEVERVDIKKMFVDYLVKRKKEQLED